MYTIKRIIIYTSLIILISIANVFAITYEYYEDTGYLKRVTYDNGDIYEYLNEDLGSGYGRTSLAYNALQGIYITYDWTLTKVFLNQYEGIYEPTQDSDIRSDLWMNERRHRYIYSHYNEVQNLDTQTNNWHLAHHEVYDSDGETLLEEYWYDIIGRLLREDLPLEDRFYLYEYDTVTTITRLRYKKEYQRSNGTLLSIEYFPDEDVLTVDVGEGSIWEYYTGHGYIMRVREGSGDITEYLDENYNQQGYGKVSLSYDGVTGLYKTYDWTRFKVTVNVYDGPYEVLVGDPIIRNDIIPSELRYTYFYAHYGNQTNLNTQTNGWHLMHQDVFDIDGVTQIEEYWYDTYGRFSRSDNMSQDRLYFYQYYSSPYETQVHYKKEYQRSNGNLLATYVYDVDGTLIDIIRVGDAYEYYSDTGYLKRVLKASYDIYEYLNEDYAGKGYGRIALIYENALSTYRTYTWDSLQVSVESYEGGYGPLPFSDIFNDVLLTERRHTYIYDHHGIQNNLDTRINGWVMREHSIYDEDGVTLLEKYYYDDLGRLIKEEQYDYDFISGLNLPWINYGYDIGGYELEPPNPHIGFSSSTGRQALEDEFSKYSGSIVRIFLFTDMRMGFAFDEDGYVIGLDTNTIPDINTLLEVADDFSVKIVPVLFDYLIADGIDMEGPYPVGEHPDLITDPIKRQSLINELAIVFGHINSSPYKDCIYAWDLMNEPDWINSAVIDGHSWREFFQDLIDVMDANLPGQLKTIGLSSRSALEEWLGDPILQEALQLLDFYQLHYYDSMGEGALLGFNPALNKPILVGEIDPSSDIAGKLRTIYDNGFMGGLFWQDSNFIIDPLDQSTILGWDASYTKTFAYTGPYTDRVDYIELWDIAQTQREVTYIYDAMDRQFFEGFASPQGGISEIQFHLTNKYKAFTYIDDISLLFSFVEIFNLLNPGDTTDPIYERYDYYESLASDPSKGQLLKAKTYFFDSPSEGYSPDNNWHRVIYYEEDLFNKGYGRMYKHENLDTGFSYTYEAYYSGTNLTAMMHEEGAYPGDIYYFYNNYSINMEDDYNNEIGFRKDDYNSGTSFDYKKRNGSHALYHKIEPTGEEYWYLWDVDVDPALWPAHPGWYKVWKKDIYDEWHGYPFDPSSNPWDPYIDWSAWRASAPLDQASQDLYSLPDWPPATTEYPTVPEGFTMSSQMSEAEEILSLEATLDQMYLGGSGYTFDPNMAGGDDPDFLKP